MDLPFDYDMSTTALIIEVRGFSSSMMTEEHNERFTRWSPPGSSPKSLWTTHDSKDSRETTPATIAGESEGYLLLPHTQKHRKHGYVFGGHESYAHILLPQSLQKGISKAHFRIYLSKHMTWMLESLSFNDTILAGNLIKSHDGRALHPERPNEVCVQDVKLVVHIPEQKPICSLEYTSYAESQISQRSTISRRSLQTSTSPIASDPRLSAQLLEGEYGYHICTKRPIGPPTPPKYEAICIRTGRHCVAKRFSTPAREDLQYANIYVLPNECEYIISYLKYIQEERMIITEFMESTTLEDLMDSITLAPTSVCRMYGQLIDALYFLENHNIIHRGIQPSTILVSPGFLGEFDTAKLTGFSCFVKGKQMERWPGRHKYSAPEIWSADPYDTRSDIFSLSSMHYEFLLDTLPSCDLVDEFDEGLNEVYQSEADVPSPNSLSNTLRGDSEVISLIHEGMSKDPDQRRPASQIRHHIHDLMGTVLETPFRSFYVTREVWTVRKLEDGDSWIRVSDIQDAVQARGIRKKELRRYLHDLRDINNEAYCRERAATKICHAFGLTNLEKHIRSQRRNRTQRDRKKRAQNLESHQIFYHAPSLMINVSHLFRVIGKVATLKCKKNFRPESLQEVRGVNDWEGNYIDEKTFIKIASFFKQEPDIHLGFQQRGIVKRANETLSHRFSSTNSEDFIILVTRRFNPNMLLLRRQDCSIDWTPFSNERKNFLPVGESLLRCDTLGLPELRTAIENLKQQSSRLDWLESQPLSDSESNTSINSTTSFRELELRGEEDDDDDDDDMFTFR